MGHDGRGGQPEADSLDVEVLDAERVRATMTQHAEITMMGLIQDPRFGDPIQGRGTLIRK
jgi:hypothetical protein